MPEISGRVLPGHPAIRQHANPHSLDADSLARFPSLRAGRVVKRLEIPIASFSAMPILHPICRIGLAVARFFCDTSLIEKCRTRENQMSKDRWTRRQPSASEEARAPGSASRRGGQALCAGDPDDQRTQRLASACGRFVRAVRSRRRSNSGWSGRSSGNATCRAADRESLVTNGLHGMFKALAGIACNVSVLASTVSLD